MRTRRTQTERLITGPPTSAGSPARQAHTACRVEPHRGGSFREFRYPTPPFIVITRRSLKARVGAQVEFLNTHDTTIGGSRSGHAPLVLWYALHHYGLAGLRDRTQTARGLARYTVDQLQGIGWPAWRHPHAMTVVLDTPPAPTLRRWAMPTSQGRSHIVCTPSLTRPQLDAFVADIAASRDGGMVNPASVVSTRSTGKETIR